MQDQSTPGNALLVGAGDSLEGAISPVLDELQIARLRLTLESRYPGLKSVKDPRFVTEEVGYKRAAAEKAKELLGKETFADLLEKGAVDELRARCKRAASAGGNLLFHFSNPSQGDLALLERPAVPLSDYFRALFELLYGEGPLLARFTSHLNRLHELGAAGTDIGWAWTTYLPALMHPRDAIFIRQKGTRAFRERLGLGLFDKEVSAPGYAWYLDLAEATRRALQDLGEMDMIDVQSLWYEAGCFRTWAWRPRFSGDTAGPNPEGLVVLPWNELGDLREVKTVRQLEDRRRAALEAADREGWSAGIIRQQPWSLAKVVAEGHLIAVVPGLHEVRGVARVIGPYEYRPEFQGHHAVPVTWVDLEERWVDSELVGRAFFELDYRRWAELQNGRRTGRTIELRPLPRAVPEPEKTEKVRPPEGVPYPLEAVAEETSIALETLQAWVAQIRRKGQAILMGPPGTGKTFVAQRLARHLVSGTSGRHEVVQFHPAYAYEDFMEGLRPEVENGTVRYELRPGHFLQLCRAAQEDPGGRYVLLLDEINRAPISRVFGELMYLLEYRDQEVRLANGTRFRIPKNVFLLGTMNTADRSIALVDHALRRRFAFFRLDPDYGVLRRALQQSPLDAERLIGLLREINKDIGDQDLEIGVSFFLGEDIQRDPWTHLPLIWETEIEPYLDELFYADRDRASLYRWKRVARRLGLPTPESEGVEAEDDADEVAEDGG